MTREAGDPSFMRQTTRPRAAWSTAMLLQRGISHLEMPQFMVYLGSDW